MKLSPKVIFALFFIFMFNAFSDAFAAQVSAVKGKQVLVLGDDLEAGELYFVVNQGKKRGIIKVVKIKGRKALAQLLKGSAARGYSLVYRPRKATTAQTSQGSNRRGPKKGSKGYDKFSEKPSSRFDNKSGYGSSTRKTYSLGGMLAYHQNSASVKFGPPVDATDKLSGTTIGFKVFGDYPLFKKLHLRGEFGTVPFKAEGKLISTIDSQLNNMNISYLGATLWARYMLGSDASKIRFWGGAGASLVFPTGTGDTNAVSVEDISSQIVFQFGGGFDYNINKKFYIPFTAEYSLFPPNDTVSASMILVKAGLGMRL